MQLNPNTDTHTKVDVGGAGSALTYGTASIRRVCEKTSVTIYSAMLGAA